MTQCLTGFLKGLCVCPDLEVFVSTSLDGTVCIWNKENQLIRLELIISFICEKNTVMC